MLSIKKVFFDFDGVFTDNKVYTDQNGNEMVVCSKYDSMGINILKENNIEACVISSEQNEVVKKRCEKMGLQYYYGVKNKRNILKEDIGDKYLPSEICFVGNDINDLDVMRYVGLSVSPRDAACQIKKEVDIILNNNGGDGAVREVCEIIATKNKIKKENEIFPNAKDVGKRLWGNEEILAIESKNFMMKKLSIKKGHKGGLQYHRKRIEMGYIVSGKMIVRYEYNGLIKEKICKAGDVYHFNRFLIHQEEALEDTVIIECSNGWMNDRVRVENKFGIKEEEGLPTTNYGEEVLL
ncbi:MAG: hypothetical protein VX185_09650 [Pseudomonadota bacterium]|nr:hypothetical protein [Pseudomonadota bacterium]